MTEYAVTEPAVTESNPAGDPLEPDDFGDFSAGFAPPPLAAVATAVDSPAHPAVSSGTRATTKINSLRYARHPHS